MDTLGLGAGLGALAFWGFLAAIVLGGMWYSLRERQAQHETLRRMIESGQPLDEALVAKLTGGNRARDLKAAGVIVLSVAPGLAVLGWLLGQLAAWALQPLIGAAILVACVGVGLIAAGRVSQAKD